MSKKEEPDWVSKICDQLEQNPAGYRNTLSTKYSRGGAPLIDKHDYVLGELWRLMSRPAIVALGPSYRESFVRIMLTAAAARLDGIAVSKGILRKSDELCELETDCDAIARNVISLLVEVQAVIARLQTSAEVDANSGPTEEVRRRGAQTAEEMDRLQAAIVVRSSDLEQLTIGSDLEEVLDATQPR